MKAAYAGAIVTLLATCSVAAAETAWLRAFPGGGRSACCYGLEVDSTGAARFGQATDGTVAVDGKTATGAGGNDIVLARLAADGTTDWIRSAGGPGEDYLSEIAVTPDGATYVVGRVAGNARFGEHFLATGGRTVSFLAHYSAAGRCEWVERIAGDAPDGVSDVAVDPRGNAVVAGTRIRPFSRGDVPNGYVAKYGPDGHRRWERRAEGTGRDISVTVDAGGRVYVAGSTAATDPGTGRRPLSGWPLVVAYDAEGAFLWRWQPLAPADGGGDPATARPLALAAAGDDGCWLVGEVIGLVRVGAVTLPGLRDRDVFLTRLSADGKDLWTRRIGGPHDDHAFDVAPAAEGGCVISGAFTRSAGFPPWNVEVAGESAGFLAAYDASGDCRWVRVVEGPGVNPQENTVVEVATGPAGETWTAGWFRDALRLDGRSIQGGRDAVFLGRLATEAPAP